jgi:acyl-CoA synthetase (AMP-forming)/AMP-acid ligase II
LNLASLLREASRRHPSRVAIDAPGTVLTYAAAWDRTAALMAWLRQRDVRCDDRVAVALRDGVDHLLLHYAVAGLGAVWVPLDHRWSAAERAAATSAFAARHLIDADPPADLEPGATTIAGGDDRPWLVSLSSGSTGRPKGALVTHAQMRERFVGQWATLGFSAADRFALVSPLCFGAGRSFGMSFLAAGGTIVLRPPPHTPEQLLRHLNESASTATFLVPTLLRRLDSLPGSSPLLPHLRRLLVSGETLTGVEAARFRDRLTPNLIGYYASSEGGGISVLQPSDFASHADTVGRASFGVEVELVDERGAPVPHGEPGLLRYRGPAVAREFLDENGQQIPGDPDGWFAPGDLATRDADGFIRLVGRARDTIVRAGVNVYPAEIERVLREHPSVAEVAVIGEASATHGESPVAFVAVRPGATADAGLLNAHCAERLAPYKRPARYVFLEQLPCAATGKMDKKALRALLAAAAT